MGAGVSGPEYFVRRRRGSRRRGPRILRVEAAWEPASAAPNVPFGGVVGAPAPQPPDTPGGGVVEAGAAAPDAPFGGGAEAGAVTPESLPEHLEADA